MLRQVLQVFLLMALLTTLAVSSIPAFAQAQKACYCLCFECGGSGHDGACKFDNKTSQCVNLNCNTGCMGAF